LAKAFNEAVSALSDPPIGDANEVSRRIVETWSEPASLETIPRREIKLLRALFFGYSPFENPEIANRTFSLLLLLWCIDKADCPVSEWDIEVCFASGRYPSGEDLVVPDPLQAVLKRWRIITLLKLLRHASELAFKALHEYIRTSDVRFPRAGVAADGVLLDYVKHRGGEPFGAVIRRLRHQECPPWMPESHDFSPVECLDVSTDLLAWCFTQMRRHTGHNLLEERAARLGTNDGCDLFTYYSHISELQGKSIDEVIRWLLVDRGLARHNRVAAGKLWQHDTFRVVDDECGAIAIGHCPLPNIAVRIGAMLSLLRDMKLIDCTESKYCPSSETREFLDRQLQSL
jgi:hypothetical protein